MPRPRVPKPRHWAPVIATLLAVTACSGGSGLSQPTMTQEQASARAEQILRDTASAVTPRPRLEIDQGGSNTLGCVADNDPRDTRVQVSLSYILRDIPAADNASVSKQILDYWKHQGYVVSGPQRVDSSQPAVFATTLDNFLVSLDTTGDGSLSIDTSSPCIWANGTPPPGV